MTTTHMWNGTGNGEIRIESDSSTTLKKLKGSPILELTSVGADPQADL